MLTKKLLRPSSCPRRVRRYSKKPEDKPDREEKPSNLLNDDENSALVQRFTQILESKLSEALPSMISKDRKLKEMYDKYSDSDRQFKTTYQKELSLMKSEPLLSRNKHARNIAHMETPWDGTESVYDSNLRMLLDLKPPPKKYQNRIITPPMSFQDRIENAKEKSLDYKIGKDPKKQPGDNFKELYKERLLGPSVFMNSASPHTTLGMVTTFADAKINASIDQQTGRFKENEEMVNVRGKPLSEEHLKNCTDSDYFMNQILNKQEILPPWIETQQSLDRQVEVFRESIDKEWFKIFHRDLKPESSSMASVLTKVESIKDNPSRYYNKEFHSRHLPYVMEKTKLLNNSIRDYNLQCPSSNIHKFKLNPELEIQRLYNRVISTLDAHILKWYEDEEAAKNRKHSIKTSKGESLFGLFDNSGGGSGNSNDREVRQREPQKVHIWKSIKEMFK